MQNKRIAIVGATGRVGREMLSIFEQEKFPIENLGAFASIRSNGVELPYLSGILKVQDIESANFSHYDIVLFSAGSVVSQKYASIAASKGCRVIDNTSFFRMNEKISLVVPEINFADIIKYENQNIIANPNCSTIQMVMALKPLHDMFGLKEVVISTYQSTSGAGQKGVEELINQTKNIINNDPILIEKFQKQIAFNVIPQIDSFSDFDYTKEELKMMNETKKILNLNELDITATCVRVPVLVGHSVCVFAKFDKNLPDCAQIKKCLDEFEGVKVIDDPKNSQYITPIESASKNEVFISRIRKHPKLLNGLSFWCVSDNLRKGAALNAIQIAKKL